MDVLMRDVPEQVVVAEQRMVDRTADGGPSCLMAIERWVGEHGLDIAAAPRESYWTDFFDADADDDVLDVAYPVR